MESMRSRFSLRTEITQTAMTITTNSRIFPYIGPSQSKDASFDERPRDPRENIHIHHSRPYEVIDSVSDVTPRVSR